MTDGFSMSERVSENVSEVTVIDLEGDLDTDAAYRLESGLSDIAVKDNLKLLLNFQKVRIMNSTAMGVLLSTGEEIRKHGGTMKFCCTPDTVREVLDLVGVSSLFEMFDDEKEAAESF